MVRWENISDDLRLERGDHLRKALNAWGQHGWELVQIVDGIAWFKRPVEGKDG